MGAAYPSEVMSLHEPQCGAGGAGSLYATSSKNLISIGLSSSAGDDGCGRLMSAEQALNLRSRLAARNDASRPNF